MSKNSNRRNKIASVQGRYEELARQDPLVRFAIQQYGARIVAVGPASMQSKDCACSHSVKVSGKSSLANGEH